MRWWQERCLEWCFDRCEDGKFGDQKYLDDWPVRFVDEVHVIQQTEKTLAPWNAEYFEKKLSGRLAPVFYHFQAFRIISRNEVRLYGGYIIGPTGMQLYDAYLAAIRKTLGTMKRFGIEAPVIREEMSLKERLVKIFRRDPHFARIFY